MALSRLHAIGKVENWITKRGKVSVNLLFFKMRNNQSQSQIYYNTRVKERESDQIGLNQIESENILKNRKGAQYK